MVSNFRTYKRKYTKRPRRYAVKKRSSHTVLSRRQVRFKPNYQGFVSGFPKIRKVSLRYCDNFLITSTLGSLGVYSFRANSIFDPDLTGVGHQPMGRDTWATLYNHYVVLGSRIVVKQTSPNNAEKISGVYLSDDTSLPYTSADGFIEAKKGTWKVQNARSVVPATCVSKYSARRFFNVVDVKDNLTRLGSPVGSNPVELAAFNVWAASEDSSTVSLRFRVVIDYIVAFSEPVDIAQS